MAFRTNNPESSQNSTFGAISRSLHWLMAFLVFGLLGLGLYMTTLGFTETKLALYGLHKSFGMLALGLAAFRLVWMATQKSVPPLPHYTPLEKTLSKLVHAGLYLCLFGMPLSGWLMSSAGDFPNVFFGLFPVPHIIPKDALWFARFRTLHEMLSYGLVGAIGLHLAGGAKHHLMDRDETLRRMGASVWVLWSGILALLLITSIMLWGILAEDKTENPAYSTASLSPQTAPLASGAQGGPLWQIDPANSAIAFSFKQYGQDISGSFGRWTGNILFDPADLGHASATISLETASLETGSDDRDSQARGPEWFSADTYPAITFQSQNFKALGGDQYEVTGLLSIRDQTRPLTFPFTLNITPSKDSKGGQRAQMNAVFTLNRLDFGVGQGPWLSTEAIDNPVIVTLSVKASKP